MADTRISRRGLLKASLPVAAGLLLGSSRVAIAKSSLPPPRAITRGPRNHWFGYYDKLQFDPTNRLVLGMEVDFEHRSPRPDDMIRIGMVDTANGDEWIELGTSSAWCWQQGCMLQWVPGTESTILWNDRDGDRFVCRILDVNSGKQRTIEQPIYALSPDGRTAVSADFRRINDVRAGYGYAGLADPFAADPAPEGTGIFRINLESGEQQLIISVAEIVKLGHIPNPHPDAKHHFYHLLFNPDGSRFVFLHRWRYPDGTRKTRMITARPDGSDIRIVDDNGLTSHFIWRDPQHILAWSAQPSHGKAFYLFEDVEDGTPQAIGPSLMPEDGHCSYLPGAEWILCDTYPDEDRNQRPFLYRVETGEVVPLGAFRSPAEYTGEWRCDTHPRHSRDGRLVCIDSPHRNEGRQMHIIDLSEIVG